MKSIAVAMCLALCVVGCASQLPGPAEPMLLGDAGSFEASLTPTSLPLVPLITPEWNEPSLRPGRPLREVIDSQAELNTFLADLGLLDPMVKGLPSAPPVERLGRLAAVDFSRYQLVAFAELQLPGPAMARIVGIEDQPGMRVVHTVHWAASSAATRTGEPRYNLHLVAVARGAKPFSFAMTKQLPLAPQAVRPSPQVGVPWVPGPDPEPNEHPRWRTLPNPEVTEAVVEAKAREMLKALAVTSLKVERRTLTWAMEQLQVGGRDHWLPESEVWVVKAEGGPTRLGPDGQTRVPVSGVSPRLVSLLFSIEDGTPLVSIGL